MLKVSISRPQFPGKADYPTPAGEGALGLDRLKPASRPRPDARRAHAQDGAFAGMDPSGKAPGPVVVTRVFEDRLSDPHRPCCGPGGDAAIVGFPPSLNELVGSGEKCRRHLDTEQLRSVKVDDKLEIGGLYNRGNFPQAYGHVGLINCAQFESPERPAEERDEPQESLITVASTTE
jgi:hypothetical protein